MTSDRGFALMAALWLVVALSVVGLEVGLSSRQERLTAINRVELSQSEAIALAGIAAARGTLRDLIVARQGRDPWFRVELTFGDRDTVDGFDYELSVRDAAAALNLNTAAEDELERLLAALHVDHGEAQRVAQSIADGRDPDSAHRARGAEREAYLEAGAPRLPRNAPFRTVTELRFILGVDSALYATVAPYLTVTGSGRVSVNAAPRPVLLALAGMTEEAAAVLERHRATGVPLSDLQALARELSPRARATLEAELPALHRRTVFDTREVEVVSTARVYGGPEVRLRALLVRGGESVFLVDLRSEP